MFDAQIQPVVLYGSEVWGLQRIAVNEKKIHTFACKRFLNVLLKTSNKMVYGDIERYPLFVNSCIRAVKYWLKLLQMKENMLLKQACHMQISMETNGKYGWPSRLKDLLCKFDFGFVWLQKSSKVGQFAKPATKEW